MVNEIDWFKILLFLFFLFKKKKYDVCDGILKKE